MELPTVQKLRKVGSSDVVTIEKNIKDALALKTGDYVLVSVQKVIKSSPGSSEQLPLMSISDRLAVSDQGVLA